MTDQPTREPSAQSEPSELEQLRAENDALRKLLELRAGEGPEGDDHAARLPSLTGIDNRLYIHLNQKARMSPHKAAAHAVHAALTAFGVHHGGPVIVLGAKQSAIRKMAFAIRDAGLTELEPGTITAGSDWAQATNRTFQQQEQRRQYRAVWPGGLTSSPIPSVIPLLEAAHDSGFFGVYEERDAFYTPWTVMDPQPLPQPRPNGAN